MMKPETQIATLRATNFFPVLADVALPDDMPTSVKMSGPAIAAMTGAADAVPALLPIGLGDLGGKFNQVYTDTFERIMLGGQDVRGVLDEQAEALQGPDRRGQGAVLGARRAVRRPLPGGVAPPRGVPAPRRARPPTLWQQDGA